MASKILVYQTAFWGDLLLAAPLLRRLKEIYPDSELHLVCRKGFGDLIKRKSPDGLGLVDVVHEFDKSKAPSLRDWVKTFRSYTFDLLICPHQSIRSQLAVWKIRARTKIGFRNSWNFMIFDQRVSRSMALPDYLRQLELLTPIDPWLRDRFRVWRNANGVSSATVDVVLGALPEGISLAEALVPGALTLEGDLKSEQTWMRQKPTILIAPGSQWKTKRWTTEGFRQLTELLVAAGDQVAFVGSAADCAIVESLGLKSHPSIRDWTGRSSPSELFVLMKAARALVTNDSGPMHLASLAKCPTVAIFGPTTLRLGYQPLNDHATIIQEDLSCRPCGLHGHEACPIGTHDCMKKISAERVFAALKIHL